MAVFTIIEYDEIGTGGAVSWSETGIASSYDHLLLKVSGRSENAGAYDDEWVVTLNGSTTTSDYSSTTMVAYNSTAPVSEKYATGVRGGFIFPSVNAGLGLADTFGIIEVWIPHYSNTATFKQVLIRNAMPNNDATNYRWKVAQIAGVFHSTAAISEIGLTSRSGLGDLAEFSTFTLYGVTGA